MLQEPTFTASGSLQGTCDGCDGTVETLLPKLSQHDYVYSQEGEKGTYTWKVTDYGTFAFTVEALSIRTQPASREVSVGTEVSFSVAASGAGLRYSWQYRTVGGPWADAPFSGRDTDTICFTAEASLNGCAFRCLVTDEGGNQISSEAAMLTVSEIVITQQPTSQRGAMGITVKFTVAAQGTGLCYQWQYQVPGGTWKKTVASGYDTPTLRIPATADRMGYQYRCIITNAYGQQAISQAAELLACDLTITRQPVSQRAAVGANVDFIAVATSTEAVHYQWQYKTPNGAWSTTPAQGNTTGTLTIPVTANRNGYAYRCMISDACGTKLYTDAVTLTLAADKIVIISQPQNCVTPATGTTVRFTVQAEGTNLQYQWQYKMPTGTWRKTVSTGYNTPTLKIPATQNRDGYQYRCVVTNPEGGQAVSDAATLTISNLSITQQPKSVTAAEGTMVRFTVAASGADSFAYQWQYQAPNGIWRKTVSTGYDTPTLKIPATASRNSNQYRCIITNAYGHQIISEAATLTISDLTITGQPQSQESGTGNIVKFTVAVSCSERVSYQWQFKTPTGSWCKTVSSGYDTATLRIPATANRNGYQYRCIITTASGIQCISESAGLIVR